jgi:hypothetical protein
MDVYRQWWTHDARWYQGVARRFGHEAANEINAEAMRYVAVTVGRRVAREFGGRPPADREELRRRYDMCSEWMFPSELRDGGTAVLPGGEIELVMRRNFAVTMVRMAGSLDGYACPCTDIHAGWSEGLGVRLVRNCSTACLRDGDPACRLLMAVADPDEAADPAPAEHPGPAGLPNAAAPADLAVPADPAAPADPVEPAGPKSLTVPAERE